MLKGIGVSPGIGLAKTLVWKPKISFDLVPHAGDNPEDEVHKFNSAHKALLKKMRISREKTALRYSEGEVAIFDAYIMMLSDDESLRKPIVERIKGGKISAEYATASQFTKLAKEFEMLEDEYMSQRSDDIVNLRDQLLSEMIGIQSVDISHLDHPTILVTHMISPADMADIDYSRLEGIICETGGYSSHTAIIARTLGVPAVFGASGISNSVKDDDFLALDGESGEIWIEPNSSEIRNLCERRSLLIKENERLQFFRGTPTITKDGHRLELSANVGRIDEVETAIVADAEAIGLFRTELIFKGDSITDEDAQFRIYKAMIEKMNGKAVTVRTYDDGGALNKPGKGGNEENPSLGYRGVRMSLGRPSFFRTQLRALLRASAYGSLKIMFPMLTSVDEQQELMSALDNIKNELIREKIPFDEKVPVGILIETPSAAIMAGSLAKRADFFTIGMNDLLQFTMAIDRTNPTLGYMHHHYHPALLHLVKNVIDAAHRNNITCNICSELPGQNNVMPLLLGLEPDGFSMNPNTILPTRQILRKCSYSECKKLAERVLKLETTSEIIKEILSERTEQD